MIEKHIEVIHTMTLGDTCLKFVNACVYSASD
jgi:hypothetical protein